MATRAEIQAVVDTRLTTLWAAIQARQDSYSAAHNGRFWQGLRTRGTVPADGIEEASDVAVRCPSDQLSAPWPLSIRTASLPMAIEVSPYDGPLGVGYQATVFVRVGASLWSRTAQVGNETWRQHGWQNVTEVGP